MLHLVTENYKTDWTGIVVSAFGKNPLWPECRLSRWLALIPHLCWEVGWFFLIWTVEFSKIFRVTLEIWRKLSLQYPYSSVMSLHLSVTTLTRPLTQPVACTLLLANTCSWYKSWQIRSITLLFSSLGGCAGIWMTAANTYTLLLPGLDYIATRLSLPLNCVNGSWGRKCKISGKVLGDLFNLNATGFGIELRYK